MGRRMMVLVLVGVSVFLMAVSAQAIPVSYVFRVTATTGPLAGVTAKGMITFDDSIIPPGGGTLNQLHLLSYLTFTWNGIAYNQITANTGGLGFGSSGNLTVYYIGTNPSAGSVSVQSGNNQWYVASTGGFRYAMVGQIGIWNGTVSIERAGTVLGDYDGDSRIDIAVYRASTGIWYIYPSGGAAPYGFGWGGGPTDKAVPGDYDGDGRTDCAVYRDGTWYIYPSGGGMPYVLGWGVATDKPAPGDYDGDGTTDIAVYRPSGGVWFVIPSAGGPAYGIGWGGDPSDVPLTPNPR